MNLDGVSSVMSHESSCDNLDASCEYICESSCDVKFYAIMCANLDVCESSCII